MENVGPPGAFQLMSNMYTIQHTTLPNLQANTYQNRQVRDLPHMTKPKDHVSISHQLLRLYHAQDSGGEVSPSISHPLNSKCLSGSIARTVIRKIFSAVPRSQMLM